MSIRVVLLQNTIAPYRIPLFERVSKTPELDFTLLLMAKERPNYPQWKELHRSLPFSHEMVPGVQIRVRADMHVCINPALLPALFRHRPDVIICNGFAFSVFWVLLYKLFRKSSLVIWSESTSTTESFLKFYKLRRLFRRFSAKYVNVFISAGSLSEQYILNLLPKNKQKKAKIFRSYNTVDTKSFSANCAQFRSSDASGEFRARFPKKNMLFSGQLSEKKNIRGLLNVYENVIRASKKPIGLIVLGQGDLREYLEQQKQERNLEFLFPEGFVGPDTYYKYFAISDLFILLSRYDPNPLVIFEALAAGLPILCTKHAGNAVDFVHDGKNGFIVDPDDVKGVAEKVLAMMQDPDGRGAMSAHSLSLAGQLSYEQSASAFIDAVKHCMSEDDRRQRGVVSSST